MADPRPLPMAFAYRHAELHCEDVPLPDIAEAVDTPVYVYSVALMTRRYQEFAAAVAPFAGCICYAVKANSNQAVIRTFAALGAGADVVSEGECRRALAAGVPSDRIVFSGVAKKAGELAFAVDAGIGQINVESEAELRLLGEIVAGRAATVRIAVRINPDVDARTHAKITTGKAGNKFGVPYAEAARMYQIAADLPGLKPTAIALHIGSQLLDLAPFEAAFSRMAALVGALRSQGHVISHLDLGGGIGVDYQAGGDADLGRYTDIIRRTVAALDCTLTFEPGRFLVAEAGLLLTRVIAVKETEHGIAILQDGAMNDLIRPTLYDAFHPIWPVTLDAGAADIVADVVGPVCESGDYLAVARGLPMPAPGQLLAVGYAGAYGAVMSSTYNTRPLVPEVMVNGAAWSVVRRRQTYEALLGQDILPAWLA